MAMDAQGALDSLLGRLTAILVSEAQLLGGVRGDVQFIKDEMESMDSLVAHIMEAPHRDHQVRTWMKHVAGLSRDCEAGVLLYLRYVALRPAAGHRGDKCCGLLAYLCRIPRLVRTIPARHRVAKRIRELKVRARDVGERRLKYGITVPPALYVVTDNDDRPPAAWSLHPGWLQADEEEEDLKRRELLYGEPPVPWPDTVDRCTNTVIGWLSENKHFEQQYQQWRPKVIRIAGRGSVGKTTIASSVYNHPSVMSSFHHRVWINHGGFDKDYFELAQEIILELFPKVRTILSAEAYTSMDDEIEKWLAEHGNITAASAATPAAGNTATATAYSAAPDHVNTGTASGAAAIADHCNNTSPPATAATAVDQSTTATAAAASAAATTNAAAAAPPPPSKRFLLLILDAAAEETFTMPCNGNYEYDAYFRSLFQYMFTSTRNGRIAIASTAIIVTTRYDWEEWQLYTLHVNELESTLPRFYKTRALALSKCEHAPLLAVLEECYPDAFALHMFLHLLYVNPYRSRAEMNCLHWSLRQYKNNTSRTILMFCYNELPVMYKTCLQYLSIFPQGHIFRRTSLIRRWLAEGLVMNRRISGNNLGSVRSGDHHNSSSSKLVPQLNEQAERIFDALVTRGFLHPDITSAAGKIKTCTMHHKVHAFIATELSFMDTCIPPDVAHRLSINSGIALEDASPPESDRPLHHILSHLGSIPGSEQWQVLKVLDLEDCKGLKKKNMENICKIVLLKYLSLRNTDVTKLPKRIKKLQCLETLDIRQTEIRAFAAKSVFFPMLKHLLAGSKGSPSSSDNNSHRFEESLATVQLPSGTQRMKRLEILSHVDASNNVDDLINIGWLLQLRKLGVVLDGKKVGGLALLFEQIEKLHGCLCSLSIWINHLAASEGTVPETEKITTLASPPKLLQSLNISGITSGLPNWITELEKLTEITLRQTYLGEDAIRVLGKLRILRCLRLRRKSYAGTKLTFSAEEFKHLKSLIVEGCDITNISFTNIRAVPKLEIIIWSFASNIETLPLSGIDHLPKLKKLELNGEGDMAAMRQAMETHPNRPVFKHNPSHQH